VRHEQSGHGWLVHSDAYAIAGHARLRYFEERSTNSIAVANAYFGVGQALHCEVFAELPEGEVVTPEVIFPVTVGVQLVHHYGAMFSAMSGEISLSVTIHIQLPHYPPAGQRFLPDGGMNGLAAPCHVARKTNVDRYQLEHKPIFSSAAGQG
jgi:hypothetical protein